MFINQSVEQSIPSIELNPLEMSRRGEDERGREGGTDWIDQTIEVNAHSE